MKKPEVLAPAGNRSKAEAAIAFGADALYLAGKQYGMRAGAGNFSQSDLEDTLSYARQRGVRVYVTVNIFAHNEHLQELPSYLEYLDSVAVDGLIVADPGVFRLARLHAPHTPLHISTQANVTNVEALRFWHALGAKRVVLARELEREEIKAAAAAGAAEVEVFVHGAMCMAYSGRCMLSKTLTGRDANLGACAQSCRWSYQVVESSRPGEYFPVEETEEGTYLFNSKDLCLVEQVPELMEMGVDSLKIEGRMKSVYYTAAATRAYRLAVDHCAAGTWNDDVAKQLRCELSKVSHRRYYTGFYYGDQPGTHWGSSSYEQPYDFVGVATGCDAGQLSVDVRNRLRSGDVVEILQPTRPVLQYTIPTMRRTDTGENVTEAHANTEVTMAVEVEIQPRSILRRSRA